MFETGNTASRVKRTALLGCICIAAAGCSVSTASYGTGTSVEKAVARDFTKLATFGLVDPGKSNEKIVYKERGTLVIPSEDELAVIPQPGQHLAVRQEAPVAEIPVLGGESQETAALARIEAAEAKVAGLAPDTAQTPAAAATETVAGAVPASDEASLKKEGFFSRTGVKKKSRIPDRPGTSLIDVPPEYRQVQGGAGEESIDELLTGKKKKKKRFLLF